VALSPSLALPRRIAAVAVCAFATHALVYGTLWPADGAHGYFGWYEPLVAALSLASLAALVGLVLAAAVARRLGRPLVAPAAAAPRPLAEDVRRLALGSLAFLLAQEALERTIVTGRPAVATFTPAGWLVLLAGLAATALALALALRAGRAVVERALRAPAAGFPEPRRTAPTWSVVVGARRRPRPLALRHGLRAPPPLPA
jgi:hypothetical protein